MTCPKCHAEFDVAGNVCPACGVRVLRNVSGVVRTSAVMISAGDEDGFYRSVQDVPEPLRSLLKESTSGDNSGTIVIADRAGKEQLTQVLARRENRRGRKTASPPTSDPTGHSAADDEPARDSTSPASRRLPESRFSLSHLALPRISWLAWAGFILVLVLAGLFSEYFGLHW